MDASGQLAAIFSQKLRLALIAAFVFVVLSGLIGFVLQLPDALKYLVFLIGLIGGVTIAAWPYFERQHIALSEWKLTLDGRAPAAEGTFEHIARTVVDRGSPVDYRVVELPELGGRRYLQLRMGNFSGLVTCVPFGADLYVSWTLWWSCSKRELKKNEGAALWAALRDFITLPFRILTGKVENTLDFALIHQFDDAKALREMVHSVTREGVQAAVGASPMTGRGTIGSAVPSGRDPQYASSR